MATCTQYYSAEDQNGDALGFTAYFDLYHYTGGSYVYYGTYGCPSNGAPGSVVIEEGQYQSRAEDYSGYDTPNDITRTNCSPDFTLVYVEHVPEGDILSGDVQPSSQVEGGSCDFAVNIKNKGEAGGYFKLRYYEGASLEREASQAWLNAGQQVDDISEVFTMPGYDYTLQVRIYNVSEGTEDDAYNITCYLDTGDRYVKTGGNDASTGLSWATAWKTVNKAATTVADGTTVHIGFGTYNAEPAGNKIAPQNIGASGISYIPETATTGGGTGTVSVEKN